MIGSALPTLGNRVNFVMFTAGQASMRQWHCGKRFFRSVEFIRFILIYSIALQSKYILLKISLNYERIPALTHRICIMKKGDINYAIY